jgi:RTX calcium-binding nonapeptide repeat (4 copies)
VRRQLVRGLPASVLGALALTLVCAAPAGAASATFDGRMFRFRAKPAESVEMVLQLRSPPMHFVAYTRARVDVGPGCSLRPTDGQWLGIAGALDVVCLNSSADLDGASPRFRLSLGDRRDQPSIHYTTRGVVYAGAGDDVVGTADRVYGGKGDDFIGGSSLYGGPGDDRLAPGRGGMRLLRGGRGDDRLAGPGLLYAGVGNDRLDEWLGPDMLVGGPGHDTVTAAQFGADEFRDVVRLRGGGADTLRCWRAPDAEDVMLLDRSDRVLPGNRGTRGAGSGCSRAQILLSGRPPDLRPRQARRNARTTGSRRRRSQTPSRR